jgi:hypothetical protein
MFRTTHPAALTQSATPAFQLPTIQERSLLGTTFAMWHNSFTYHVSAQHVRSSSPYTLLSKSNTAIMTRAQQTISIAMLLTSVRPRRRIRGEEGANVFVLDIPRGIHGGRVVSGEDPEGGCACCTSPALLPYLYLIIPDRDELRC